MRKRGVDSAISSAAIVARPDISERCADNVRNLLASQVPRAAVARVLAKAARAVEAQTSCYCCGQVGYRRPDCPCKKNLHEHHVMAYKKNRRPDCPRRNESCSLCGKRGHLSHVCRSSGGNASARAVEAEPAEPEEERNSTRVGTVSLRHFWTPVGRFVCLRQLRSPF